MARRPALPNRTPRLKPDRYAVEEDGDFTPIVPGDEFKFYLALGIDDETVITDDREVTTVLVGEGRTDA